jgi:hypothetical protein
LWANFKALIGIFSQSVGPSLAIWANPVQFSSKWPRAVWGAGRRARHRRQRRAHASLAGRRIENVRLGTWCAEATTTDHPNAVANADDCGVHTALRGHCVRVSRARL